MNFSKKIIVALTLVTSAAPATFAQGQNQKSKTQKAAAVGTAVFSTVATLSALLASYATFLAINDGVSGSENAKVCLRYERNVALGAGALGLLAAGAAYLSHKQACSPEKEKTQKKKN